MALELLLIDNIEARYNMADLSRLRQGMLLATIRAECQSGPQLLGTGSQNLLCCRCITMVLVTILHQFGMRKSGAFAYDTGRLLSWRNYTISNTQFALDLSMLSTIFGSYDPYATIYL